MRTNDRWEVEASEGGIKKSLNQFGYNGRSGLTCAIKKNVLRLVSPVFMGGNC
jgi:hypothetical protein